MVEIEFRNDEVIFKPLGWSRLWTLQNRVVIPLSAIRGARRAERDVGKGWWKGWRMPGTHIPGVIVAGSYVNKGVSSFWDVRGAGDHAIEVDLERAQYHRLIVDVADPDAELRRLNGAITTSAR